MAKMAAEAGGPAWAGAGPIKKATTNVTNHLPRATYFYFTCYLPAEYV